MARIQQTLMTGLVCAACWSCSSRPATSRIDSPIPPAPTVSPRPTEPGASKPTPTPDPCPPLKPNEVSEDDTPGVAGTSGRTKAGAWLEARGVSKAAFRTWVRSRDPRNLEDFDADSLFDNDASCQTLTVGDKSEDALVCTLTVRTSIMRSSAVAFVVRNKRIVSVLEVGYSLPAMDWPAHWLDLQLTFAPGGLEADLHDRAKPGTVLVMPPSDCHEHFKRYLACEQAHRDGVPSGAECPQEMDASGKLSFGHMSPTPGEDPIVGGPVELFGCAEALPRLDDLVKQTKGNDAFAAEFRDDRAFATKSCKARGRYVWKGDRFVRSLGPGAGSHSTSSD